jgi:hypothetical protein
VAAFAFRARNGGLAFGLQILAIMAFTTYLLLLQSGAFAG